MSVYYHSSVKNLHLSDVSMAFNLKNDRGKYQQFPLIPFLCLGSFSSDAFIIREGVIKCTWFPISIHLICPPSRHSKCSQEKIQRIFFFFFKSKSFLFLYKNKNREFYFFKVYFVLIQGSGEGRKRERNISQLPTACASAGDQTCNQGMCPDEEPNPQPFGLWDNTPANWATPARVKR